MSGIYLTNRLQGSVLVSKVENKGFRDCEVNLVWSAWGLQDIPIYSSPGGLLRESEELQDIPVLPVLEAYWGHLIMKGHSDTIYAISGFAPH